MTPSAMTAAGRAAAGRATTASARTATRPAPDHRRRLRSRPAPALPRRVSGPTARPRTAPAPRHHAPLGVRALAVVRSLPEHSLIDRLVRGRAWIPVLGVLLAGIVAMQVEVLKLGTNVGRYVQQAATLQGQNEALQANVASLSDDQRIEQLAGQMGMEMPSPTSVSFLSGGAAANAAAAVANIHVPDPTGFADDLADQAAAEAPASDAVSTTGTPSLSGDSTSSDTSDTTDAASGAEPSSTSPDATAGSTTSTTAAPPPTQDSGATDDAGSVGQTSSGGGAGIAPAVATQSSSTGN
jgi:cell division protein FtsL